MTAPTANLGQGQIDSHETYAAALRGLESIAVVGLSDKPHRTSHEVSAYLQRRGYRIIPVNPNIAASLGEAAYPTVRHVPHAIDIVLIFRRSEDVPPVVDDAVAHGTKLIWMQSGIRNDESAQSAASAGIPVVMDACLMVVHRALMARGLLPASPAVGP